MTEDEAERSCERLRAQRSALAEFGLIAFRSDDLDALLNGACELVSEALDVPLVKVLEHLPERDAMLIRAGVNWDPGVVGNETFGDHEKSPGGYALRSEEPVVSPDLSSEDRFETPDVLRRHGVRSMVNVIVAGEQAPFGVLEVDAREPRDFDEDDIAFLRNYANLIAAAIDRVRAHGELRRSAREQRLLARELAHRVKNLLGLIRALASLTATDDRTAAEFRSAFVERLQALSIAESLVFDSRDERADPLKLAREILAPYRREDASRIAIEGASPDLPARHARIFGLALHELATNAAKHGALGAADGYVRLELRLEEDAADGKRLAVTWREMDGPEITPPERTGFGTRLLEDVVANELGGKAELIYEPHGLRYHLRFRVEESRP